MKKILVTLMLVMLLITLVSAEAGYTFKKSEDVNFSIKVFNEDNSKADGTVDCYITMKGPNLDILLNDSQMAYDAAGDFTYFINGTLLTTLGEYPTTVRCGDGVDYGYNEFIIKITPTGEPGDLLGLYIILFAFMFGIIIFGYAIRNENIAIIGGMGLMILGIYTIQNGIDIYDNMITQVISAFSIAVGAIVSLTTGLEIMRNAF